MNIQIFGSSKSFDSKKAERWFKERRIKYQYIDLVKKGVSPGEYRSIRAAVGYENLVNRECLTYRELGMDYLLPDAAEEKLLLYPEMFRAPIVRNGRQATVGYQPDVWAKWEVTFVKKGRGPFFDKGVSLRPAHFCVPCTQKHTLSAQSVFCDVHAAKNGLELFRGLRAANSVRLLLGSQRLPSFFRCKGFLL